jgi:hypothetical protein
MRPGWLIITFLIAGIVCTSARAESEAPSYLLVPPLNSNTQSDNPVTTTKQQVVAGDHELIIGTSPSFTIEFADVRDQTGSGFDDPAHGAQRRDIAEAVFTRVSQILEGEPGSARIVLDSRSPWLNQNTLAIGVPFFQCIDGFQKPIIHGALKSDTHVHTHEGELLVNFDLPLHASQDVPPVGQYDLYTVLYHEIIHIMGFVGFTVEPDGRPQDCGGARMLPALARFTTDDSGQPLWKEEGGEIQFLSHTGALPSSVRPILLDLPNANGDALRLATSELRVSGHWLPEDFVGRAGVLMLREPFPSGQTRRNMTPETKSILREVLELEVGEDKRGLTGAWADAQLDGQGFTIQFLEQSRFVIFFFGFSDNGVRQWLLGNYSSSFELGQEISIPMIEATGGRFNHSQAVDITELPWGELKIRFLDCLNAEATLSGVDGVVDMSLFPLARVGGLDCY